MNISINMIMSNSRVVPFIMLGVYACFMILIAYYCRKKASSINDFLLAGRGLGGWMSAFAYGTTYFSAAIFIGYAGNLGWRYGLGAVWIGLGNAIIGSLLAWLVLANRTRKITNRLSATTMPEFFEKRYQDKNIKLVSAIVIFIFLIPYSASVYQGLAYIFEMVFGLDFVWAVVIIASLTALYLFFGGYFATAVSNFVQGMIMLVGAIIMVSVLMSRVDSFDLAALSERAGFMPSVDAPSGNFMDSPFFNIMIITLLTSFGIWGVPQSIHKFYAIKDKAAIKKGTIVSTIFAFVIGVCAYLAGSLTTIFVSNDTFTNDLGGSVDRLMPEVLSNNLPIALLGLIVVLILSASMSTLSSLSLAGSSSVAIDIYKGYIKKDAQDKKVNILLKVMCVLFIVCSAVFAIGQFQAIVALMSLSWGTLAGCFIGPYVYGLYSKKSNKAGAWASMIGTLIITISLVFYYGFQIAGDGARILDIIIKGIGKSPLIGVLCMLYSVIITPIFNAIFHKRCVDKELVEMIYAK